MVFTLCCVLGSKALFSNFLLQVWEVSVQIRVTLLLDCLHAAAQCAHVDVHRDRCIWATMAILYTLRTHVDV